MTRIEAIRARRAAITPPPWYDHATDDDWCMNARYVGTVPPATPGQHDGLHGMGNDANPGAVVAVTLLQHPGLAVHDAGKWDEDAEFIAHAPTDIDLLLAVAAAARQLIDNDGGCKSRRYDGQEADAARRTLRALFGQQEGGAT